MYDHYLWELVSCLQPLSTEQIWHKEAPNLNTRGGIVLHMCEHVKRNSIRFSNKHLICFSQGIEGYFPNEHLPFDEFLHVVHDSFEDFDGIMKQLLEDIPEEIDMYSLYHLVEHTDYHLG